MNDSIVHDWQDSDLHDRFDALIFDCDGTLTDSMPLHYIAWRDTMRVHGIDFTEQRFYSMGGMPTEKIIAVLSDEQNVRIDIESASLAKERAFEDLMPGLRPLHAVCEVARRHLGKLPMAVASGGIRPIIRRQLESVGISDWFTALVTSEDTRLHKPEPDAFLLAAKLLDVPPERCLVFEDSPLGFEAARRALMSYVDVRQTVA